MRSWVFEEGDKAALRSGAVKDLLIQKFCGGKADFETVLNNTSGVYIYATIEFFALVIYAEYFIVAVDFLAEFFHDLYELVVDMSAVADDTRNVLSF